MRKSRNVLAGLVAVGFLSTAALLPAQTASRYEVDPAHSYVSFQIRHLISKVTGSFNEFSGAIIGDPKDPTKASVELTVKAASIDTRIEKRDAHLRSPDFFEVEKYPEITFKSTRVVDAGGGKFDVAGQFTMHGVSKEITVPVSFTGVAKDPWGMDRAGFEINLTLNRKDYGVLWNKALDQGGMLLDDDVQVMIALEVVRK